MFDRTCCATGGGEEGRDAMVCGKLCSKALDDEWYILGSLRPSMDSVGGFQSSFILLYFQKKKATSTVSDYVAYGYFRISEIIHMCLLACCWFVQAPARYSAKYW